MKRVVLLLALTAALEPLSALASDRVLAVGVWPNRLQFLDEDTLEVVAELPLRHGVVVWDSGGFARTSHAADFSKLYFITGRLDTLEIVDVAAQKVVDEVKLATPERMVRIMGALPSPDGKRVYLTVRVVDMESDRFIQDLDQDIVVYNLETREVEASFAFPDAVGVIVPDGLWFGPEGDTLFAPVGGDIYEFRLDTQEVVQKHDVGRASAFGFGARNAMMWYETSPSGYDTVYFTKDPVLERDSMGILHFDAARRTVTSFEIGPKLDVTYLTFSPDRKRLYLGGHDAVVVDVETRRILAHKEGFERGRTNTGWVASEDGSKLIVGGVGDRLKIYDGDTLELIKEKILEGDAMFAPFPLPRHLVESSSQ